MLSIAHMVSGVVIAMTLVFSPLQSPIQPSTHTTLSSSLTSSLTSSTSSTSSTSFALSEKALEWAKIADHTPLTELTEQTPSVHDPVRIIINQLGIDRPLYAVGLDQNRVPVVLKHDIGWYHYSARPGEGENVVLWGHVLRFRSAPNIPAPFADIHTLPIGSPIMLVTGSGTTHTYIVTRRVWAMPNEVSYILPQGQEQLTLVSCIGDQVIVNGSVELSHRLITIALPAR